MTKLMEELVARAQQLPAERQDEFAALMLDELDGDQAWEASFAKTTDEQWQKLADRVRQQIREGKGVPLNSDDL